MNNKQTARLLIALMAAGIVSQSLVAYHPERYDDEYGVGEDTEDYYDYDGAGTGAGVGLLSGASVDARRRADARERAQQRRDDRANQRSRRQAQYEKRSRTQPLEETEEYY